jgi:predicted DNA-binding transcriptional regulator YafY
MRTFRLDRIQETVALSLTFNMPSDFSVREYLARTLWFEPKYRVEVHVDASMATQVRDIHGYWMDLADQPDGSIVARFGATNLEWTTGWVLGLGSAAKASAPPELVTRVVRAAQGALRRYPEAEAQTVP